MFYVRPPPAKATQKVEAVFTELYSQLHEAEKEAKYPIPMNVESNAAWDNPTRQSNEYILSALYGGAINHPERDYKIQVDRALETAAGILNPSDMETGKIAARELLKEYTEKLKTMDSHEREIIGDFTARFVKENTNPLPLENKGTIEERWTTRAKNRIQTSPNQRFP